MKRRWYHYALAFGFVFIGSVGITDAHAQTNGETRSKQVGVITQAPGSIASQAPSRAAYRASVLPREQRAFRACVKHRESRGRYDAQNRVSSAQGAYQFLDNKWRHGLAHMVTAAVRGEGVSRPGLKKHLRATPIKKWEPVYQDVAFAAVLNARGPWSGAKHWHLAGSKCNQLIRR